MSSNKPLKYQEFYRRKLPHIQPEKALFFITYRLDFQLPADFTEISKRKKLEYLKFLKNFNSNEQKEKLENFRKILFDDEDNILTKIKSPQWLNNPLIAEVVKKSLFFRHKTEYDLLSYCIMPNHVHILIKPLLNDQQKPFSLQRIIHNHKSFTANQANKILNRKGKFWYPEFYDHYIRNEKELLNVVNYILQNPVKAKLTDHHKNWEYNWVNKEVISL